MQQILSMCINEEELYISSYENSMIFNINKDLAKLLGDSLLANNNINIKANEIVIQMPIEWNSPRDLTLISANNIILEENAVIKSKAGGHLFLKAGIENKKGVGSVIFKNHQEKQIYFEKGGKAHIYYNPTKKPETSHKYHNPQNYFQHIEPMQAEESYMLVNDVYDLQDINLFLHGNYALSADIHANLTKTWHNGKGFEPLTLSEEHVPFSGKFDGNSYTIDGLFINRPGEKDVGLFGIVAGQKMAPAEVSNLKLKDIHVKGNHYVGSISGDAEYAIFSNIEILSENIEGRDVIGGVIGTAKDIELKNILIHVGNYSSINANQYKGLLLGSAEKVQIYNSDICSQEATIECVGYAESVDYL